MAEVRRTIRFDEDVWTDLETAIEASGRTMTAIVNEAVRQFLRGEKNADERLQAMEKRLRAVEEQLGMPRE